MIYVLLLFSNSKNIKKKVKQKREEERERKGETDLILAQWRIIEIIRIIGKTIL